MKELDKAGKIQRLKELTETYNEAVRIFSDSSIDLLYEIESLKTDLNNLSEMHVGLEKMQKSIVYKLIPTIKEITIY